MNWLVENIHGLIFYFFAALAIVSALGVVTMRNPVYSAIGLLSTFLGVAGMFLLLKAEFLFVVQIFVYGGGVMVLFLFVIMLVNLHRLHTGSIFVRQVPMALLLTIVMVAVVGSVLAGLPFDAVDPASTALVSVEGEAVGNSEAVAWALYRQYPLPFEIASVFLLVAMVGAVVLGRRN